MGLLVSTNWKNNTYDSILIIVDWLTKIVYYELVNVIIDVSGLTQVILNLVIEYHGLPNSILSDWDSVFLSKLWLLLSYYTSLGLNKRFLLLSTSKLIVRLKNQTVQSRSISEFLTITNKITRLGSYL